MPGRADLWNAEADSFDDAVDHGLKDPVVRQAWGNLLLPVLGPSGLRVADLGCGTGSVSLLLAEAGHQVSGVDFASAMIERARRKTATVVPRPEFLVADAADPPLAESGFDVVVSRHVLWAMPDPADALRNWCRLLTPAGRLILVEGDWSTGAGLSAAACSRLVEQARGKHQLTRLDDPIYWGAPITDERYLIVA